MEVNMEKSDVVLIIAVVGLTVLGIGVLVEHADIKLLYYIAGIIGLIAGVPIAIPKIARHIKEKRNVEKKE